MSCLVRCYRWEDLPYYLCKFNSIQFLQVLRHGDFRGHFSGKSVSYEADSTKFNLIEIVPPLVGRMENSFPILSK